MSNLKRKNKTSSVLILLTIMLTGVGNANASTITASRMLEMTNESRNESGLGNLAVNDKLVVAANAKAEDMFSKQYFEHVSPEGLTPWYWFGVAGYEYIYAAENLAIDFITAEGAHSALMKSTGHRDNILGKNYQEIGIAVVSGEFEGRKTIIIVEEFGSKKEPKITMNNATFFEQYAAGETSAVGESPEVPTPIAKSPEKTELNKTDNASVGTEVGIQSPLPYPDAQPREDIVGGDEGDSRNDVFPADTGATVAKVYAVRNMSQLKKVYVEDIYWEKADGDDIVGSLGDRTIRFRTLLRDLTSGLLYISSRIESDVS